MSALRTLLQEYADNGRDVEDPVQGSVTLRLIDGSTITGLVEQAEDDMVTITRIYQEWSGFSQSGPWREADSPQHIAIAHVVRAYYNEAGA